MQTHNIARTISLAGAPEEVQLIPYGTHETAAGSFTLDAEAAASVIAEFRSRANQSVIDYEHQTLTGDEAPAAGWIEELIDRGEQGVWGRVRWTDRARAYIASGEYRYMSPVFLVRASDSRVARFINAALTNQPAIDGMCPLDADDAGQIESPLVGPLVGPLGGQQMKGDESMQKVLEALGLPQDATEQQAVDALAALSASADQASHYKRLIDLMGLDTPSDEEVEGTLMAMKQATDALTEALARASELEAKLRGYEAEQMVAVAMKEGRISPAQRQWAVGYAEGSPEAFRAFVAKSPVVVPMGEHEGAHHAHHTRVSMDSTQRVVNEALGLADETYKKHTKEAL